MTLSAAKQLGLDELSREHGLRAIVSAVSAPGPDGPVSVREVAEMLGVHPQTIRRLIHEGKLDGVRIGSGLFVPRAAVDELVARQRRRP